MAYFAYIIIVLAWSLSCYGKTIYYVKENDKGRRQISLRKLAHAIYKELFQFKNRKFSSEKFGIFLIFAQNIDCGYMLEPPP